MSEDADEPTDDVYPPAEMPELDEREQLQEWLGGGIGMAHDFLAVAMSKDKPLQKRLELLQEAQYQLEIVELVLAEKLPEVED
jgi:hypothetical protein